MSASGTSPASRVFQICTLNQTASEIKKRQEIGRGLRLPVDQDGERCHDGSVEVRDYVHETKGSPDPAKLRFPHEKRKIECARRYFARLGVTYAQIDPDNIGGWWEPAETMRGW